jgi:hypothetical protein
MAGVRYSAALCAHLQNETDVSERSLRNETDVSLAMSLWLQKAAHTCSWLGVLCPPSLGVLCPRSVVATPGRKEQL